MVYIVTKKKLFLDCRSASMGMGAWHGDKTRCTIFDTFLAADKYCKINNGDFIESLTQKEIDELKKHRSDL